ncbi:IgA-binding beta antigen [Streptococcus pneumoniae]|uniref:YSIRK signal domain/LPXTG anchor domain surface protein n=1 Tax=Streptococcus pneumoniae TaxID=1313 RepID=UPI0005E5053F|nr:YSIRK signal domain/LPXTG anchor domain surface protein [Streptococcus pneumoniae]CIQ89769.1 IgA-binding beta antigen [Streptococcus pneumoniae]CJM89067.1 IgA-binding beta antigen [Streptococcus pneumoniae]
MRARHERRNRYSIRKFSVGVASVVVATFFCVGGGGQQVVQAADGARSQGVSSPLDPYRKTLHELLGRLSLTEGEKERYKNQIDTATERNKLFELESTLDELQNKEIEEAVEKAKTTLPNYMNILLQELEDKTSPGFPTLLNKLKDIVTKSHEQLENLPNRKSVEDFVEQAKEDMNNLIAEYKKGLTAGTGDNNGDGQQEPQDGQQAPQPQAPQAGDQTFTGTAGGVKVTVLFDKSVNAEKVTIKEVTQPDLVERIARQAGGGSIRLFDLSLTKNGKETHVNEDRIVRLALEGLGENVQVYHVKADGQLELLESKVEDGHVIFRVNHFSLFAIKTTSSKSNQETPSNQATPSTQAKSTPKETTKDATSKKTLPNTGTADSTALLAAAASTAILGLGLAGHRRKED